MALTQPEHRPQTRRRLGRTDLAISPVALGFMSVVPNDTYSGVAEAQAVAIVDAALDEGINFFDTAPAYGGGESERLLGVALRGRRDQAVIATKASGKTLSAKEIAEDCETSLRLLQTDVIDLYQIHWPRRQVPLDQTLRAMERLVGQGKVRALGVCNFGPKDLAEAQDLARLETNQMVYSLLARAVEYEVQGVCEAHDMGVLCYSPLAQGLLTGRFKSADEVPEGRQRTRHFSTDRAKARHGEPGCEAETFEAIAAVRAICEELGASMPDVALAWLLHQPAVAAVLAGASRPEQVRQNAEAGRLKLGADVLARLDEATAVVKEKLGPNPDMWSPEPRIR